MTALYDIQTSRLPGILIVDPDPEARTDLARGMEREGWHVWLAGDGDAAVETYIRNQDRIDLALIDLQLPGLQGGLVLGELAELNPDLPRCAMSADVSPYAASAFRRMSDTPLFIKPLEVRALAFTLHEMAVPIRGR